MGIHLRLLREQRGQSEHPYSVVHLCNEAHLKGKIEDGNVIKTWIQLFLIYNIWCKNKNQGFFSLNFSCTWELHISSYFSGPNFAVNNFRVMIIIIEQLLNCKCCPYCSSAKELFVLHSLLTFMFNNCDNVWEALAGWMWVQCREILQLH